MRTKKTNVAAVIVADLHLRDSVPDCRTDAFLEKQAYKLDFIRQACGGILGQPDIPLLIAGDLFHHWRPSPFLLSMAIQSLPKKVYAITGQHDLPYHNLNLIQQSGFYTLMKAGILKSSTNPFFFAEEEKFCVAGFHYGQHQRALSFKNPTEKPLIGLFHLFTYQGTKPWPSFTRPDASAILKSLPQFDLLIIGDNHQVFEAIDKSGRMLLSPGCMMRQSLAAREHKPSIWLWIPGQEPERIPIPIQENIMADVDHVAGYDMEAYAQKLGDSFLSHKLSFNDNLNAVLDEAEANERIRQIIARSMEGNKEGNK